MRVGLVVSALELLTALALAGLVMLFAFGVGDAALQDVNTGAVLVLVSAVWITYVARAYLWEFVQRRDAPVSGLTSGDAFADELRGRAEPLLIELDEAAYLPVGASESLVEAEAYRANGTNLPGWLSTGQSVLISLGLVGTFLGLTLGLIEAVPQLVAVGADGDQTARMQKGMEALLNGAKLAFVKSMAGVWCGMLWGLRYRHVEEQHAEVVQGWKGWLDRVHPPLSTEKMLAYTLTVHARQHEQLLDAVQRGLGVQTTGIVEAMQRSTDALDARMHDGIDTVSQLAETLPEQIGSNAGGHIQAGLQPSFEELARSLRELSQAGGQAIGETLQGSMEGEVTSLRQSLAQLSEQLHAMTPRLTAQLAQAESQVQQGAASAALALTEAGRQTSDDLRGAASELSTEARSFQVATDAIRETLAEAELVARSLRGAGLEVQQGLAGVAEPLVGLPRVLEGAQGSLSAASSALSDSTRGSQALLLGTEQLAELLGRIAQAQQLAMIQTERLTSDIERLRGACDLTVAALGATASGHQAAGADAARQLVEAVTQFRSTLEEAQQSVSQASRATFDDAQTVTVEAARKMAVALEAGSSTLESSMIRMAAYGQEIEQAMAAARETAAAIETHAGALRDGARDMSRPFGDIAAALGQVAPEVRSATEALRTERDAMGQLGRHLTEQAAGLTQSSADLGDRIRDYQALQATLSREWAVHVQGIDALLERIKLAWAQAVQGAETGVDSNAKQLAEYARRVENALRLPGDLRQLNETIGELSDVLDDLKSTLEDDR